MSGLPPAAQVSAKDRTDRESKERYPALHLNARRLIRYGVALRAFAALGIAAGAAAIAISLNMDNPLEKAPVSALGWSLIGYAGGLLVISVLFSAGGEAAIALADIATNTETANEMLRRPPAQ